MKKCIDRKGITILMTLLLLLVASMVSVVILTAATTAARHISNDRQSQQAYLTSAPLRSCCGTISSPPAMSRRSPAAPLPPAAISSGRR